MLESIVNTGFENACLIVSNEYFYEWHESTYGNNINQYIHTREYMIDKDDETDEAGHEKDFDHAQNDERDSDFKTRSATKHAGKWTKAALRGYGSEYPLPSVMIGTFDSITGAISRPGNEVSGWAAQIASLVDAKSIDALIVDETSQLWSGYALALLPSLRRVERIVLVGDSHQLAPYGASMIPNMQSLFDAALHIKAIPHTMLNETFRLSPLVASVISSKVYGRQLQVRRDTENQAKFFSYVDISVKPRLQHPIAQDLIERMLAG